MICASGYNLVKCQPPHPDRIEEAKWLIPHFLKAKKTKTCLYHIVDIRQELGLDSVILNSLKDKIQHHGYHSKGAIAMMLIEAGFSFKIDEHGAMLFNLSKKTRITNENS